MQKKIYRMGKRFRKYSGFGMVLASIIIFFFYFLYDMYFVVRFPLLKGLPLISIFMLIEIFVIWLIYKVSTLMIERNYYEMDRFSLTYVSGEKRITYSWEDFESVAWNRFEFSAICPIYYTVKGKKLTLNQYLDDIWGLNRDIMQAIGEHVQIDPKLKEQVMYMA